MKLAELRERLQGHGVVLAVDAGQLKVTAPRGALTLATVAAMKRCKAQLLEALALEARCAAIDKRVGELVPAAEVNELFGNDAARALTERQWKEIGDLVGEGLMLWEKLQRLQETEIPETDLAEAAA